MKENLKSKDKEIEKIQNELNFKLSENKDLEEKLKKLQFSFVQLQKKHKMAQDKLAEHVSYFNRFLSLLVKRGVVQNEQKSRI